MSEIRIPMNYHSSSLGSTAFVVEHDASVGEVCLTIEGELEAGPDGLTRGERRDVVLDPDEARAIAAALVHFASEAEAGR